MGYNVETKVIIEEPYDTGIGKFLKLASNSQFPDKMLSVLEYLSSFKRNVDKYSISVNQQFYYGFKIDEDSKECKHIIYLGTDYKFDLLNELKDLVDHEMFRVSLEHTKSSEYKWNLVLERISRKSDTTYSIFPVKVTTVVKKEEVYYYAIDSKIVNKNMKEDMVKEYFNKLSSKLPPNTSYSSVNILPSSHYPNNSYNKDDLRIIINTDKINIVNFNDLNDYEKVRSRLADKNTSYPVEEEWKDDGMEEL